MNHDVQELMHRAVRDVETDPARLAYDARRRGLAIRRRRQALGLVGAAAAVALVVGGTQVVTGIVEPSGGSASGPAAAGTTVRATGEMTAAALVETLQETMGGTVQSSAGQGGPDPRQSQHETFASVLWLPPDGSAPTLVELNVQPVEESAASSSCEAGAPGGCGDGQVSGGELFETFPQPDGAGPGDVDTETGVLYLREDGVQLSLGASTELPLAGGATHRLRLTPGLTTEQLVRIVKDPAFGLRMDASYAGEALAPPDYRDLDLDGGAHFRRVPRDDAAPSGWTRTGQPGYEGWVRGTPTDGADPEE